MKVCSKCSSPVGDDAIGLKNGTCVCQPCFEQFYADQKVDRKPKRVYINLGAVAGIALVLIGIFAGYKMYRSQKESGARNAAAEMERQREASAREITERAAAEAARVKAEKDHYRIEELKEAERQEEKRRLAAKAELESKIAQMRAAEEEKRLINAAQTEALRKRMEEERIRTAAADEAKRIANARAAEIPGLARTVDYEQGRINKAEAAKTEDKRKLAGWKVTLANLIKEREANPANSNHDKDIDRLYSQIDKLNISIAEAEGIIQQATTKLGYAKHRLDALKATPEEMGKAPTTAKSAEPQKSTQKKITLKSGVVINVKTYVDAGDSITFKGEDGKFQTINKSDVEKLE